MQVQKFSHLVALLIVQAFHGEDLGGGLWAVCALFSILKPGLNVASSQLGKLLSTTGFKKSTAGKRTLRSQLFCKVEATCTRRGDFRNPTTVRVSSSEASV